MSAILSPGLAPPQTRRQRRERFRGDIEGLRAVAVVLVVAFHAGVGLVGGGFVGVDVFFVLSGFLITGLLVDEIARTGTISIGDFYARRVRRLLPLSSLVLAATAVAAFLLVPPIDRRGIAGDLAGAALWGANWRFAAESTQYMADTDKSPVLHYWSLSVEEQFYVVWPLLLLLLVGRSGLARRAWPVAFRRIAVALGVVVLGSLVWSWGQTAEGSPFAYFGLHTRAWELGVGAALALARPALALLTARAAHGATGLGAAMVVGSALFMDEATPFPGTAALVPVLGTALLVGGGARLSDRGIPRLLAHPVPRYIGRMSYAWYLWHWPVLVLANARWGQAPADGGEGVEGAAAQASWPVVLAAVALSFGLAVASHYVVEQPMRQAGFFRVSRHRSLQLGGGLVAISLLSSCALLLDGVLAKEAQLPAQTRAAKAPGTAPDEQRGPFTPAEAREDLPRGGPCYMGYEGSDVPPADECRVGPASGGKRTIALIGDSHATHWRPALERAAEEKGWTVYFFAKTACPVIDVAVSQNHSPAPYESCAKWRENVLERVAGIKDLDAVVIGRYMGYRSLALQGNGSRSTPASVGPVWEDGAQRSFEHLRRAAKRIVVLEDIPWPKGDVPSCLSEHLDDVSACAFERGYRAHMDEPLVKAERAAGAGDVRFVDMTDVLCPGERCQVVTSTGQVMYRDGHHLTKGYSASLWQAVTQRIDAAIG